MALSGKVKAKAYRIGRMQAKASSASEFSRIARQEAELTDGLTREDHKIFLKWVNRGMASNLEKNSTTKYRARRPGFKGRKPKRHVKASLRKLARR